MKRMKRVMVVCDCEDCNYLEKETYYTGRLIREKHTFFKCRKLGLYWKHHVFFNVYEYCPLPKHEEKESDDDE